MARYLSRADLSHIAGKYIDQYYTRFGISKDDPEPIDPERLDYCFIFQGQFFHFCSIHRDREVEDNLPNPVAIRLLFRE